MSLIVETGAGLATAESYISVADADARMTALGNDTWDTLSEAEKEQTLRRSTTYMEQTYRSRWRGYRQVTEQALSWPRNSVVVDEFVVIDSNIVPPEVKNACADLALKAAAGDLNPDLTTQIVRERVGPIETEYSPYSPRTTEFRAIDMMLAPFLKSAGARLVRA